MAFPYIDKITRLSHHMNIRRRDGVIRLASSFMRPLPDTIIIGAQKSGTTSLFYYLIQHPEIVGSRPKEVHFFDEHFEEGPSWYRAHFPIAKNSHKIEGSPSYLFLPEVPERIKKVTPNAKLIAILRNPTKRAISSYYHQVRAGKETLPLMEALQQEEKRLAADKELVDEGTYKISMNYLKFSYKKRGHYLEQLERYWQTFDKSQLLILTQEAFLNEPMKILKKVFQFIGVDDTFKDINFRQYNVGANKREVPSEVTDYLNEYFTPYNEKLANVLDIDLGW